MLNLMFYENNVQYSLRSRNVEKTLLKRRSANIDEILLVEIFKFLNNQELTKFLLVSKEWRVFAGQKKFLSSICREIAFGKEQWEKHGFAVKNEPPLPPMINDVLEKACPFFPEKKIYETHKLILIPENINGTPVNLNHLIALGRESSIFDDHEKRIPIFGISKILERVLSDYGNHKMDRSRWILITNTLIANGQRRSRFEH